MTNKDLPAFPTGTWEEDAHGNSRAYDTSGMTLRQYAAIKLKVPDSGIDWLDDMIRKSLYNDLVSKAMLASRSRASGYGSWDDLVADARDIAGATLKVMKHE